MRTIHKGKILLLGAMLLLFSAIGVSYGAWSQVLSVRGMFTTASFDIIFGHPGDIQVHMVDVDTGGNITTLGKIEDFIATQNEDKNIHLEIDDGLLQEMLEAGRKLRIEYPLRSTEQSSIKVIRAEKLDWTKTFLEIEQVPDQLTLFVGEKEIALAEGLDPEAYKMRFHLYRQTAVDVDKGKNTAVIFVEAKSPLTAEVDGGPREIASISYEQLLDAGLDPETIQGLAPQVPAQVRAKYRLKIELPVEQFNTREAD